MSNVILENEKLRLEIAPRGAEMQSMRLLADNREQLWQGDAAVWGDRAPWLFPLIGQLRNGEYRYCGQAYRMPMHGFAAGSVFSVAEQTPDSVLLQLEADEETLKMFPWRFVLDIAYRLQDDTVEINCAVRCADEQDMYFSLGAHPGFLCSPGDRLTFEGAQHLDCRRLCLQTHLLRPENEVIAPVIELQEELFDDDAMLLYKPACDRVVLTRADGSGVRVWCGRVPWTGIWSRKRKGLPYVCIEPWYGVDDLIEASGNIEEKPDIVHLLPGKQFEMQLKITPFC